MKPADPQRGLRPRTLMGPPPAPAATAGASTSLSADVDIANQQQFPALPSSAGKHSRPASTAASTAASPCRTAQRKDEQPDETSDDVLLADAAPNTPAAPTSDETMQPADEELLPAAELADPVMVAAEEPPATVRKFRDQTRGRLCHLNRTNFMCFLTLALQVNVCSYCNQEGKDHMGGEHGAPLHECKEKDCTLLWVDSCIGKAAGDGTRKRCLFHLCCDAHDDPTCSKCDEVPTTWKTHYKADNEKR